MFRRSASDLSERLTEGPIINSLLRLAWPVMLSNLLQTMYNFVDRFWLARLGKVEIAALAISWPLIFLVLSLGAGVTVAGTALVAQYTGARRFEEANLAAGQVLAFTGIIAIVLAAAGFFAARPILSIMGAEPALTDAATGYLRVIYAGIPLMFGTFIVTALLNGVGDTITPMILMAVSVGVNLILDPFFIFGWGPFPAWGVIGAAVATVLSRGLLALIGFTLLFTGRLGIHIRPRHLKLRWEIVRRIISIGGLSSIGQTGTAIGFSIMNGALARIGTVVLSAFGIGNAFISIVLMPAMGGSRRNIRSVFRPPTPARRAPAIYWRPTTFMRIVSGAGNVRTSAGRRCWPSSNPYGSVTRTPCVSTSYSTTGDRTRRKRSVSGRRITGSPLFSRPPTRRG